MVSCVQMDSGTVFQLIKGISNTSNVLLSVCKELYRDIISGMELYTLEKCFTQLMFRIYF